jgi:hypothetical protein
MVLERLKGVLWQQGVGEGGVEGGCDDLSGIQRQVTTACKCRL